MEMLSKAAVETMVKLIHDRIASQVLEATGKLQDRPNGKCLLYVFMWDLTSTY